jgi:hypothetical protein
MKEYSDSINVQLEVWPSLIPVPLKTDLNSRGVWKWLDPIRGASAQRLFTLERDWEIKIDLLQQPYPPGLAGTIVIPKTYKDKPTQLDGASIPCPWLVSFLSFGIFRPEGVLLIASIIHDFAFEHGKLLYRSKSGHIESQAVSREIADQFFYDINRTVNHMPYTARLAWLAVRLGWLVGVRYNGKRFGGKVPYIPIAILVVVLIALGVFMFVCGLQTAILILGEIYLVIFVLLNVTAPRPNKHPNKPKKVKA